MENVHQKLANIRQSVGLSQKQLAYKMGYRSSSGISRLESGYIPPTPAFIEKFLSICRQCGGWTDEEFATLKTDLEEAAFGKVKKDTPSSTQGDYSGIYYLHNFPSTGEDDFIVLELRIEKNMDKFLVHIINHEFGAEFKGEMFTAEQNIYIKTKRTNADRYFFYLFHNPPTKKICKLWGFLLGPSVDNDPRSAVVLLCNQILDKNTLRAEFEQQGYTCKNSQMVMRKNNNYFSDNT